MAVDNMVVNKEYVDELIESIIEIEDEKGHSLTKNKISALKNRIARKYKLVKPPRDIDIILSASAEQLEKLRHLKSKPTRSLSGVAVVAVMSEPRECPHGKCVFCPGGVGSNYGDTPQSYTGFEPSTRRAKRNEYDSFRIAFNRLEQYALQGHNPNKVDCIIMGGTFPSYDIGYQIDFVTKIYLAMNVFSDLFYVDGEIDFAKFKEWFELPHHEDDPEVSERLRNKIVELENKYLLELAEKFPDANERLEYVKKCNETSAIRCIGLTVETRPDFAFKEHVDSMLKLGVTRVEMGVQSLFDSVLEESGRGHTIQQTVDATKVLKDLGMKINYHMMIGMPGSNREMDEKSLSGIFDDPKYRPDMLKIYPCLVLPGTKIYDDYVTGDYVPYRLEEAVELIGKSLVNVPEYCRIMRIQRDIPSTMVEDGVNKTNLKQYVDNYLDEHNLKCRDIRSRELPRAKNVVNDPKFEIVVREYDSSDGKEFFISAEDVSNDVLIGFCRLRFVNSVLRSEFSYSSAIIRELHVYGSALNIGQKEGSYADAVGQHRGWGKKLVARAEEICKEHGKNKLLVISGVGVREYYRKLGFSNDGPYVSKSL